MSQFYNPRRSKNIFNPEDGQPFKLSRSKVDSFLRCKRCFYIDRRLGVGQPPGFPFNLNTAVDTLLKKEFDFHRIKQTPHPLMKAYGIEAIPFQHARMDEWRDSLRAGVQYLHEPTNLLMTGGVDDIWVDNNGALIVVDYKATSKDTRVTLDAEWQIGYKRQMEFYQWLLRRNGFVVNKKGYFVYCNGKTDRAAFDGRLDFDIELLDYEGDDSWVEKVLPQMKECLMGNGLPAASDECDFCLYRGAVKEVLAKFSENANTNQRKLL